MSINAERTFEKILYPFSIETRTPLGIAGKFLSLRNDMHNYPIVNTVLNREELSYFP